MGTSATEILGRTQLAGLFILLFFPLDTTHLDGLIFEVQEEFRWHIAGSTSFCVHKSSYFEGYQMLFYYIHTEKYSPKSIRKWVLANQRSELWFSHVKKMIRPIRIANDIFSRVRKNDTSNQKPQRCVSFAPKFPPFIAACWAPLRKHSWRKIFSKSFFSLEKWKTFQKWSGIVSFVSLSIKKTVESRRNNSGRVKNRTRRKLMLCFLSELLCFPFISLSLYWNRTFYLNSPIFNCTFKTNS